MEHRRDGPMMVARNEDAKYRAVAFYLSEEVPSTASADGDIPNGTEVRVLRTHGDTWTRVETASGLEGWVKSKHLVFRETAGMKCPKGHGLRYHRTIAGQWCDVCKTKWQKDTEVLRCMKCDWDTCAACFDGGGGGGAAAGSSGALGGGGRQRESRDKQHTSVYAPGSIDHLCHASGQTTPFSSAELATLTKMAGGDDVYEVAMVVLEVMPEVSRVAGLLSDEPEFQDIHIGEIERVTRPVVMNGIYAAHREYPVPESVMEQCRNVLRSAGSPSPPEHLTASLLDSRASTVAGGSSSRDVVCESGQRFRLERVQMGSGSFAGIHRAHRVLADGSVDPIPCAAKLIKVHKLCAEYSWPRDHAMRRLRREIDLLSKVQHRNVVPKLDHHILGDDDGPKVYVIIFMEFLQGGALTGLLKARGGRPLHPRVARRLFAHLADGLRALHWHQIAHRDLKPDNLCLTKPVSPEQREPDAEVVLKIIDLGIAAELRRTDPGSQRVDVQDTVLGPTVGTYPYMAPETFEQSHRDGRVDCWACGCILYQMQRGRGPFPARTPFQLRQQVTGDCQFDEQGNLVAAERRCSSCGRPLARDQDCPLCPPPDVPEGEDEAAWRLQHQLVDKLLQIDPKRRLTAEQMCADPWLVPEFGAAAPPSAPAELPRRLLLSICAQRLQVHLAPTPGDCHWSSSSSAAGCRGSISPLHMLNGDDYALLGAPQHAKQVCWAYPPPKPAGGGGDMESYGGFIFLDEVGQVVAARSAVPEGPSVAASSGTRTLDFGKWEPWQPKYTATLDDAGRLQQCAGCAADRSPLLWLRGALQPQQWCWLAPRERFASPETGEAWQPSPFGGFLFWKQGTYGEAWLAPIACPDIIHSGPSDSFVCLDPDEVDSPEARDQIERLERNYQNRQDEVKGNESAGLLQRKVREALSEAVRKGGAHAAVGGAAADAAAAACGLSGRDLYEHRVAIEPWLRDRRTREVLLDYAAAETCAAFMRRLDEVDGASAERLARELAEAVSGAAKQLLTAAHADPAAEAEAVDLCGAATMLLAVLKRHRRFVRLLEVSPEALQATVLLQQTTIMRPAFSRRSSGRVWKELLFLTPRGNPVEELRRYWGMQPSCLQQARLPLFNPGSMEGILGFERMMRCMPEAPTPAQVEAARAWVNGDWPGIKAAQGQVLSARDMEGVLLLLSRRHSGNAVARSAAVRRVASMNADQICDLLPQLVQGLRHDPRDPDDPSRPGQPAAQRGEKETLREALLRRATDPATGWPIYASLWWLLKVEVESGTEMETTVPGREHCTPEDKRARAVMQDIENELVRRSSLLFQGRRRMQQELVATLRRLVKDSGGAEKGGDKGAARKLLREFIRNGDCGLKWLFDGATDNGADCDNCPLVSSPLAPEVKLLGAVADSATFFNSANAPMLIEMRARSHVENPRIIFKAGDDLRRDDFVVQLVRIMNQAMANSPLAVDRVDPRLTAYGIKATGPKEGMIECIGGNPVSLQDCIYNPDKYPILRDLGNIAKRQSDGLTVGKADLDRLENWVISNASSFVLTYVLGVGDRHLENLLVKDNGMLVHIDFGFVLGKDPKVREPRGRLRYEMVEAMGGRNSCVYQRWVSKACSCYLLTRSNSGLLLSILYSLSDVKSTDGTYMLTGEASPESVQAALDFVEARLGLQLSDHEAMLHMEQQIEQSINDVFARFLDWAHAKKTT